MNTLSMTEVEKLVHAALWDGVEKAKAKHHTLH